MHLKFLRCQQMFCCFSVKNMGCKPTLCLLFCEVVYGTGISNHWLLLCVQFWCCVIEIALVIRPPCSIFRNHNLESFRILAWLPIFLQCIMLAHQAALYIKLSTSIEVINNNRKPYWLNESKYLWNVLMCPFVLHTVNSILATHWHMLIIGSSQLTVLLTPLNLCLIILKMQNLFSDTWFPILQFMLDLELTSLNVWFSASNFAQRRLAGTVSWSQRTQ